MSSRLIALDLYLRLREKPRLARAGSVVAARARMERVTRLVPLLQSGQIADLLAALRAEPDSRTGEPFALPDARGAAHETDPRSGR